MTAVRSWCCGTPLDAPHVPGCSFEPKPDDDIDWAELLSGYAGGVQAIPEAEYTPAVNPCVEMLTAIDQMASGFDILGIGDIAREAFRSAVFVMFPLMLGAAVGAVDELEYFEGIAP